LVFLPASFDEFFGEEKFSWLPGCGMKITMFQPLSCFLECSQIDFSSPKKFIKLKQVKITNILLKRPQVLCSFAHKSFAENPNETPIGASYPI
jgi:hypothetical protein